MPGADGLGYTWPAMDSNIISQLQGRVEQQLFGSVPAAEGWPEVQGEIGKLVSTLRDVTLIHEQQTQAQVLLVAQLRAVLDNAFVGIALTRNSRFELMGRHACLMLGYSEEEFRGQSTRLIFASDEAYVGFGLQVREAFKTQDHFDGEQILRRKDGSVFWSHMLARGVIPGDPGGGTIWIMEDISEVKAARDKLSWTATHDSLTQLANRQEFELRLAQAMAQFQGRGLCVMFIDLDRFKVINDTAGHATGDEVLRQIARLLEAQVRESDTVGRLGGDEFAVLLPGCSLDRAQQTAEQIRSAVDGWRLRKDAREFSVGASIGVASVGPPLTDISAVLQAADSACYDAKKAGRNCVCTFVPDAPAA